MTWLVTYIVPFVILLGVLVFVHEAGHFLTAKYFRIVVEKFSIGFGPRIFGTKVGDTEYRLAWIPLGGYVKMVGDDPRDDDARDLPGSFLGAPLWKRMLVVLAGPAVNLILPVFILAGVYMVGKEHPAPWVGTVGRNSPAERAGLRAGDEIVAVNGVPVTKWDDMTERIRQKREPVELTVSRDGERRVFTMTPELRTGVNEFGVKGPTLIIGITQSAPAPVIAPPAGSAAERAGLKLGDRLTRIGDRTIDYRLDLATAVAALAPGRAVEVEVTRRAPIPSDPQARAKAIEAAPQKVTVNLIVPDTAAEPVTPEAVGFEPGDLVVSRVEPDSPAEIAGIRPGDRIVASGSVVFGSELDFNTWLDQEAGAKPNPLTLLRDGQTVETTLTPVTRSERITGSSRTEESIWAGLALHAQQEWGKTVVERYRNPFRALAAGVHGTVDVIAMNVRAFRKIFTGELSARDSIGGPIAIAHVAGLAAKAGVAAFIEVLVHMSVILGLMNLLPIPVLDGGHLAFFTIEAILRRPPSIRVREIAQQAGLLLLLAVMAFVLVNDVVTRVF